MSPKNPEAPSLKAFFQSDSPMVTLTFPDGNQSEGEIIDLILGERVEEMTLSIIDPDGGSVMIFGYERRRKGPWFEINDCQTPILIERSDGGPGF